jgi:RecD/TraA family predicted helicase
MSSTQAQLARPTSKVQSYTLSNNSYKIKISDGTTETIPRQAIVDIKSLHISPHDPLFSIKVMLQEDPRYSKQLPIILPGTTFNRVAAGAERFCLEVDLASCDIACHQLLTTCGVKDDTKTIRALVALYELHAVKQNIRNSIVADLDGLPSTLQIPDTRDVTRVATHVESYETFRQDPYVCFESGNNRVPFGVLDAFATIYSVETHVRCERYVEFVLRQLMQEQGHSCVETNTLVRLAANRADNKYTREQLLQAITDSKILATVQSNQFPELKYVYTKHMHKMESYVAKRVQDLVTRGLEKEEQSWEDRLSEIREHFAEFDKPLSSKQRQAVELIFTTADILVLTGYPGTGKSSVVACIQELCSRLDMTYAIMAPTGKAANRLGDHATTVHRALDAAVTSNGEFRFGRGPNSPLPFDLVILDEASMLDASLAYHLFRAIDPLKTRVLVIGDPEQLPPVDAGCFLRALIESEVVPSVRLTKIYRQDSLSDICKLARTITKGSVPSMAELQAMQGVVWISNLTNHASVHTKLVALYKEHGANLQVLIPAKKGGHGTQEVNKAFHDALFSSEYIGGFETGDKVVCVKNCYHRDTEGNIVQEKSVFNGETGTYVQSERNGRAAMHMVNFGEGRDIPPLEFEAIELGYALTVHKSQGSEYDAVALVLHPSHGMALKKELLYTAITRAKGVLYILSPYECLARCAATPCAKRVSLLADLICAGFDVIDP